jgi:cytochrome o ubiquinol oxidase subunit II
MKRGVKIALPVIVAILLMGLFAVLTHDKQIDVLAPAGVVAEEQRLILMFALLLSALVVVPVFTLLIVFSVKYRASNSRANYDPEWSENTILEGVWWGVPIVIIGVLGVMTFQTSHSLDPYKKIGTGEQISVQVIGLQWKWLFIYPDHGIATLNYAPIPVNQPVHLALTTEAPMSSLWIPSLGSQIYAMNGMESQLNLRATKLGEYTGYNTNINGEGYAKMTFKTKVMAEDKFKLLIARVKANGKVLDMATYDKIAEPETVIEQRSYKLVDGAIYTKVLDRNMTHGAGTHVHNGSH